MSIHAAVVWRPKLCAHLDWISGTGQPGVNGFLEHLFMVLVCFYVCVGFGCLLVVGFLWGFVGGFKFVWEVFFSFP